MGNLKGIKSNEILYSKGSNDECYTPEYGVRPLLKYIPKDKVIWCPFDTKESNFVKLLRENGNKVIHSHIDDGEDYYEYEPDEHWDIMVSNPPFTQKRKIFERALSFDKPFALLMTMAWLNDAAPVKIFGNNLELILFDKRIKYNNGGEVKNKITFSSGYYCYKLLDRAIVTENIILDNNKSK